MGIATFLGTGRTPTRLRGLMFLALSETAVIQARTAVSDEGGGAAWTWATKGTALCRVAALGSSGSHTTAGRADERSTHMCHMPPGTAVDLADRVVVSGRGTFEVTGLQDRTGEAMRVVEVMQV
jgi:Phage head-tail joining protein